MRHGMWRSSATYYKSGWMVRCDEPSRSVLPLRLVFSLPGSASPPPDMVKGNTRLTELRYTKDYIIIVECDQMQAEYNLLTARQGPQRLGTLRTHIPVRTKGYCVSLAT